MRARNVKPGFFKNEDLAEVSHGARLLFVALWCMADREGRLEDRPKRIKAETFPYEAVDVDALLCELADRGFIVRYGSEPCCIWVPTFLKHQTPHKNEKTSELPAYSVIEKLPDDSDTSTEVLHPRARLSSSLNPDSLNPDSLNPDSLMMRPKKRTPRDGDWVGAWVDAERAEGREPGKSQKATFGRKIKELPDLDPATMTDTIKRMANEMKHPGVLPYVYDDCRRAADRECLRLATEARRVR